MSTELQKELILIKLDPDYKCCPQCQRYFNKSKTKEHFIKIGVPGYSYTLCRFCFELIEFRKYSSVSEAEIVINELRPLYASLYIISCCNNLTISIMNDERIFHPWGMDYMEDE